MTGPGNYGQGAGLALSGGGFRATLFHVGSLWRLNELGWLSKLSEVTSVSGGSIIAGHLGLRWKKLRFDGSGVAENFVEEVVNPIRSFCSRTIDVGAIIGGILSPFRHPSDLVISKYKKHLYGDATLQSLPSDEEGPRFTIYATSLQTGASVRFSRPYLAEYHIGRIISPEVPVALAVAASSAFPPVLCPVVFEPPQDKWERLEGADLYDHEEFREKLYLGDGGIYDNLGLERIWDRYGTVLVSDAGAPFEIKPDPKIIRFSQIARTLRTFDIIGEQARALRKRALVENFKSGARAGAYWGITTRIGNYRLEEHGLRPPMTTDSGETRSISEMRTRLNAFSEKEQGILINWGYALTDAAIRRHVSGETAQGSWPVPGHAL